MTSGNLVAQQNFAAWLWGFHYSWRLQIAGDLRITMSMNKAQT